MGAIPTPESHGGMDTHHKFINEVNKLIYIVLTGLDTHTPANITLAGGAQLVANIDAPRLSVGLILEAN